MVPEVIFAPRNEHRQTGVASQRLDVDPQFVGGPPFPPLGIEPWSQLLDRLAGAGPQALGDVVHSRRRGRPIPDLGTHRFRATGRGWHRRRSAHAVFNVVQQFGACLVHESSSSVTGPPGPLIPGGNRRTGFVRLLRNESACVPVFGSSNSAKSAVCAGAGRPAGTFTRPICARRAGAPD